MTTQCNPTTRRVSQERQSSGLLQPRCFSDSLLTPRGKTGKKWYKTTLFPFFLKIPHISSHVSNSTPIIFCLRVLPKANRGSAVFQMSPALTWMARRPPVCGTSPCFLHRNRAMLGEGDGNPLQYSCLENLKDKGA